MIPFTSFTYFSFLLYPLVVAMILGLWSKFNRHWLLGITVAMVALQYNREIPVRSASFSELWLVVGYVLYQWALVVALSRLKPRVKENWPFYIAVGLSLLPLVLTKLPWKYPVGFLGLSYFTFRALDVLIAVQDKLIKSLAPLDYFNFLLFFPTTTSGPIDRFRRFSKDLGATRSREVLLDDLSAGIHHIFTGFLYKFILAYLTKTQWLDPVEARHGLAAIWSYMYAYSFYLFFDFAGYSAFAVGVSRILGIRTPENFRAPFAAHNIREFWERWHITLSSWFRDHVYMRFVMTAGKNKWFTGRYTASYLGFMLSMGLMGIWHGTAWHYIVYGLYHGALMVGYDRWARWNKQHKRIPATWPWRAASVALTFHVVCFGFLIFSGRLF